jgi:hypothetical protein
MSFTNLTVPQNSFLISYLRGTGRELTSRSADSLYGMTELRQLGFKVRTQKNTVGTTNYAVSRRLAD